MELYMCMWDVILVISLVFIFLVDWVKSSDEKVRKVRVRWNVIVIKIRN